MIVSIIELLSSINKQAAISASGCSSFGQYSAAGWSPDVDTCMSPDRHLFHSSRCSWKLLGKYCSHTLPAWLLSWCSEALSAHKPSFPSLNFCLKHLSLSQPLTIRGNTVSVSLPYSNLWSREVSFTNVINKHILDSDFLFVCFVLKFELRASC